MQSSSIKTMFAATLAVVLGMVAILGFGIRQLGTANEAVSRANQSRYASYLLADEMRQSSDDLTRLARTYVVSGDPKWEQQYLEILAIRNGSKPRPKEYEKIYWDFRAADIDPGKGYEATISLNDLMKQAGFTDAEFAKLKEAGDNSNDLVKTETIAMNLVKGHQADGQQGSPDLEKARSMMHDAAYHRNKAKIMKPVDEFLSMLDHRTHAQILVAETAKQRWFTILIALALLLLVSVSAALHYVYRQIARSLQHAVQLSDTMAAGDLSLEIEAEGPAEVAKLLHALKIMHANFVNVVSKVRSGSEGVSTASSEIAQGNMDLSARTEAQASALEQTAASMEELNSTVKQNADNARQANQLAQSASNIASTGGDVVSQVVLTMQEISQSSNKIADIISVIDGIAFQTNILALNAAVEAARAGEQGRGFAVVATEVRSLAGRSAEAAKEIKQLISDSVQRVEQGSALADTAGSTMTDIVASIKRVADIMGEISSASIEQSQGVAQVGDAVTDMDTVTQQNAALVEQMAAAAAGLKIQAKELVDTVAVFKLAASIGGQPAPRLAAKTSAAPRKQLATARQPAKTPQPATADWEEF
ncbi:methyl-accepting chemotaxis protein [Duganella sp. CF402]|uniref:methyl-accepting chemotaxis protein n=1 Tax=unclassified Duganella TaxID=2636909 RepID=UPI0008B60D36|nr:MULTISPECIES: methyl-accepting chemotaxis protein [unclassified Duganella]RZT09750.1 methyl-accepting chemotaxis protein [Duganella sp. BK701]SEL44452.1 methyl-accepting chemotaxis protein [Duganella sp. CF402]